MHERIDVVKRLIQETNIYTVSAASAYDKLDSPYLETFKKAALGVVSDDRFSDKKNIFGVYAAAVRACLQAPTDGRAQIAECARDSTEKARKNFCGDDRNCLAGLTQPFVF
jgi:hypothetical protein